jgi:hypothetical protein
VCVQVPAFVYYDDATSVVAHKESPWALTGLILAVLSFTGYLWYQFKISGEDEVSKRDDSARPRVGAEGAGLCCVCA